MRCALSLACLTTLALHGQDWDRAIRNANDAARAARFSKRLAWAWLDRADPRSGLLPRNLLGSRYWNAEDSAADNWPFHLLTAEITGSFHLRLAARVILEQERLLTKRLGTLPDDFHFDSQGFHGPPNRDHIIFGASEYAKDGLMPLAEYLGQGPWLDRLAELVEDIWTNAPYESQQGTIPSLSHEVNGNLLQVCSRLYWITGDVKYRNRAYRLADYYLFENDLLALPGLRLSDHSCEVLDGLVEAYVIAASEDPLRRVVWRPRLHRLFDRILEAGRNADGLLYTAIAPSSGAVLDDRLTDNWGYTYSAILTLAVLDNAPHYRRAVESVLERIGHYRDYLWEGGSADGYADSVEGAINLLNRIPVDSAWQWVDATMQILLSKQRPDGLIEAWHGDGNSARTAWMWALWKTQGVTAEPWTDDLELGAVPLPGGGIGLVVRSEFAWDGVLRFARPRHRVVLRLPFDYPRINQFQEWFTVDAARIYLVQTNDGAPPQHISGSDLLSWPVHIPAGGDVRITVIPE